MTTRSSTVYIEAPGRLHFGVLDLDRSRPRWFGGVGAACPGATVELAVRPASTLEVSGEDAARARQFAERVLKHFGVDSGVRLHVKQALPPHAGLGSGTQLALAVGRGVTEALRLDCDILTLARIVGRGDRSAIGTYAFIDGGLLVEGGGQYGSDRIAPLVSRLRFPPQWWCVVGVPIDATSMSGDEEAAAFRELPCPPPSESERVAHRVLMGLLPAVVEADLEAFGEALTEIQAITGRWWAPAQGGPFAPGPSADLVEAMRGWGAHGVGQSSWGPAVYGIVEGEAAGKSLAERVRESVGPAGRVYVGTFPETGARVWRGAAAPGESIPVTGG